MPRCASRLLSRLDRNSICTNSSHAPKNRSGFTLTETIVVVVIVGLIAFLVPVSISGALRQSRLVKCGDTQRKLLLCMQTSKSQNDPDFPHRSTSGVGGAYSTSEPTDSASARATAIASLEWISFINGLGTKLFACPENPELKPTEKAGSDPKFSLTGGIGHSRRRRRPDVGVGSSSPVNRKVSRR